GPQVGNALLRNELASTIVPELPLGVLVASTAGWIGYMIQQSLQNGLSHAGVERQVVTQITQVVVDPAAAETGEPTKFIGRGLTPDQAGQLRGESWLVTEDPNGVTRRVVPSPIPLEIVERETIRGLVDRGVIVIAVGGGGTPVYRHPELGLEGIDAVVDKDRAAALLGSAIGADSMLILTDVDAVYRDYGSAGATRIDRLTIGEAQRLLDSGELGQGSMRPKVQAATSFLRDGGERAVIARLDQGLEALAGTTGTEIVR
ncbi:MAG: carbamate kinase, partial [Gemmatimonadota bacterium]